MLGLFRGGRRETWEELAGCRCGSVMMAGLTMIDHRSRRNGSEGSGKPWFAFDDGVAVYAVTTFLDSTVRY